MSLKKYSELSEEQKKRVHVMYSNPVNLEMYLYNFDEHNKYHGRQFLPVGMSLVNEPVQDNRYIPDPTGYPMGTVLDAKTGKPDIEKEEVKEDKPKKRSKKK